MKDIRLPFLLIIVLITLLAFCKSAPAAPLNAEQKALVIGLTKNNEALTKQVAVMTKQLETDAATALFAEQKIESLALKLKESKDSEAAQLKDLISQQTKIQALADDRDRQAVRADSAEALAKKKTLEAHKNAQERDIFVWAFAVLASTAACYALFPVINKVLNVTFPWTLAWIVAWIFLVGVFYGIERAALRYLINHLRYLINHL